MSNKTNFSVKELNLYNQLHDLRNIHLHTKQQELFDQWVHHYQEHLDELYEIYCKHQYIDYHHFLLLAYECTMSMYDFTTKSYKRFLL